MKRLYFVTVIFFATGLLVLFVFYNRYANSYQEEQMDRYISKNIDILNENLAFERQYALSLSLYASKNKRIREALRTDDQKLALQEIDRFLREIRDTAGIFNIDIQVHTETLRAFARNWDKSDYKGTELGSFRKGLVRVKQNRKPFVSIELGKRLNIKAISPILDQNGYFMGSIEVIMDFRNIKKRLRKFNMRVLGLLNEKFIDIAVDLRNNVKIGKYYILEKTFPKVLYQRLKRHPKVLDDQKFYHRVEGRIIVLVPMKSVGIEDVGIIALSMRADSMASEIAKSSDPVPNDATYTFEHNKREVHIK